MRIATPAQQGTVSRRAALRLAGAGSALGLAASLGACQSGSMFSEAPPPPEAKPASPAIGSGSVKVGLILPLSASGNAGSAAQSLRNAAELALVEFNAPDISLVVKDDGGSAQGGQQAAEQALADGCEILLGPLFAVAVRPAGQIARQRGVPVIAFSTDAQVAARGVYLLSFLPASDVDRIVSYAVEQRRKSFVALLPDNAYGQVVEAEFQQAIAQNSGRVLGIARYSGGQTAGAVAQVAASAKQADCVFIPDNREAALERHQPAESGRARHLPHGFDRHRAVGRSCGPPRPRLQRRLVRRARQFRLPRLRPALPGQVRGRAGAHGLAVL